MSSHRITSLYTQGVHLQEVPSFGFFSLQTIFSFPFRAASRVARTREDPSVSAFAVMAADAAAFAAHGVICDVNEHHKCCYLKSLTGLNRTYCAQQREDLYERTRRGKRNEISGLVVDSTPPMSIGGNRQVFRNRKIIIDDDGKRRL
jgi:hypothetical protein